MTALYTQLYRTTVHGKEMPPGFLFTRTRYHGVGDVSAQVEIIASAALQGPEQFQNILVSFEERAMSTLNKQIAQP